MDFVMPTFPASAGAMLFDRYGRLLIVNPTYKDGWNLPGGMMEADGESPWDGCRREVREEIGLEVTTGRLAAIDSRPGKKGGPVGLRFLFDCGVLSDERIARIRLQEEELSEFRFVTREGAIRLLRPALARRVNSAWGRSECVYLENGLPVDAVTTTVSTKKH